MCRHENRLIIVHTRDGLLLEGVEREVELLGRLALPGNERDVRLAWRTGDFMSATSDRLDRVDDDAILKLLETVTTDKAN